VKLSRIPRDAAAACGIRRLSLFVILVPRLPVVAGTGLRAASGKGHTFELEVRSPVHRQKTSPMDIVKGHHRLRSAMKAWMIAGGLVVGWSGLAPAQEPSGRIDLDLMAAVPASQLVVGRVTFVASQAVCPQQFGTFRFRADGRITLLNAFGFLASPAGAALATTELDDETYRHRVANDSCRVDFDIREQVLRDNAWTPLLLPRMRRPSLSPEQRSEAERQFRDSASDLPNPVPAAQFGRYVDARNARSTLGSLGQGVNGTMATGLAFDGAPRCFDAVGDYLIDQSGAAFQFVTGLPGALNRFVMERIDVDDDRSRLQLTSGDCRVEITISASVLANGEWVARSVAPFMREKRRLSIKRAP
jgi:hypothetical protein